MTVRFKVPMRSMGRFEMALAQGFRKSIAKAMKVAARQCIPVLASRTWDAPPASDSPYSVGTYPHVTGTFVMGWEVDFNRDDLSVHLYNNVPYAGVINSGVRPAKLRIGRTAIDRIEEWIKARKIQFNDSKGRPLTPRQMTWAITQAMKKRKVWALKPRTITQRSALRVAEIFKARMLEYMARAVAEAVRTKGASMVSERLG